jgi:hypothetical protein
MRTTPTPNKNQNTRLALATLCLYTMPVASLAAGESEQGAWQQAPKGLSATEWSSLRAVHAAQQSYVKPSNAGANDYFGFTVAVSGDTVVIGAPFEDSSTIGVNSVANESAIDAGAAYVYVRNGASWTQQAYLKASNTGSGDLFGRLVNISGDTILVGAPFEDSSTTGVNSVPDEAGVDSGAAYVYVRNGASWSQQAYLKASITQPDDAFGIDGAISGDTVVIGAPAISRDAAGAAYVFVRSAANWAQQANLIGSNSRLNDFFGNAVAISGDTVVVGAPADSSSTTGVNSVPNELATFAGAAYVFARGDRGWVQQAYLKASNTGVADFFGNSVAISGDTVVIGAELEDSSTTGANSVPNEAAADSGAAYIYVRTGANWSQQTYLKASNTGPGDNFGFPVAISGNKLVIGAPLEDSSSAGVNSAPNDEATDAGGAYVYERTGATWAQQAYLKASNSGVRDRFGIGVALSDDIVVIGAHFEDSSSTGVNSTPDELAQDAGAAYIFDGLSDRVFSDGFE